MEQQPVDRPFDAPSDKALVAARTQMNERVAPPRSQGHWGHVTIPNDVQQRDLRVE